MPTRNALAAIRLTYARKRAPLPYRISIQVWSHSYDHPDPARRSAMIGAVYLSQLAVGGNHMPGNVQIVDRYGIDETRMWTPVSAATEAGFEGYIELDTGSPCQPGFPSVLWGVYSGIYDERCLADPACDAMRLHTYIPAPGYAQLAGYNYVAGPLTFNFDLSLPAVPTAVRLRMTQVGGNGGNPAQRNSLLPPETFTIQVP
jgi:hypothetical protein